MNKILVKYRGKYKDLIPRGYKFCKLYARNYRTYFKNFDGYRVWIWVKGNDLELEDFYENSGLIIKYLVERRYLIDKINTPGLFIVSLSLIRASITKVEYKKEDINKIFESLRDSYYDTIGRVSLLLNKETGEIKENTDITEVDNPMQWRGIYISRELFKEILDLYDNGLIELVETEIPSVREHSTI